MAKDGLGVLFGIFLFSGLCTAGAFFFSSVSLRIITVLGWIFFLFSIYFFRDPDRTIPTGEDLILSAADGKVVQIKEVKEDQFLHERAVQISIFLSIFDVHVNRNPISGRVGYFAYHRGKFMEAFKDRASLENEQTVIGLENDRIRLVVKQIAGILARRIVCHVREGFSVKQGERFGMIMFGSRVDMIIPLNAQIRVKVGDRVKGGETIIANI